MGFKRDNDRYYMTSVRLGPKGQIVIPKEAREMLGIKSGDTLLILGDEQTGLIVSRPEVLNKLADKILNNMQKEE